MSRIGIGMPVFNAEDTLPATLDALRLQTFTDYELYVINDGSTDNTLRVFDMAAWNIPLIVVDNHSHNIGIQKTRNELFNKFWNGGNPSIEFFFYCDADLNLHPRLLESMISALDNNPDKTYAYCGYRWTGMTNLIINPKLFNAKDLTYGNYISMMSMIRMEHLKTVPMPLIDEDLERLEDWALWLKLLKYGKTGICTTEFFEDRLGFVAFMKPDANSARGAKDYHYWRKIVQQRYLS